MTILFFGSYDPEYSRNRVLIKGLKANGVNVIECNECSSGPLKFIRLAARYWKGNYRYDIMLVPFPGQEVMLLARALSDKPIVFDAFTSHYGGYILDRGKHKPGGFMAGWYRLLDIVSCRIADLVLLDTDAHIRFFNEELGLPTNIFRKIFVGSDSSVFKPASATDGEHFTVHFHGNYIPLQGVEYIIRAAEILKDENILFKLIGRGQTYRRDRDLAESLGLKNIEFIDRVPYEKLPEYMNAADVCLGIFGKTLKADIVIPNKVFEALACSRPVITADTRAIGELLKDGENVILCQKGNPYDLADKIRFLYESKAIRNEIGKRGYELFLSSLTEDILAKELVDSINERGLLSK